MRLVLLGKNSFLAGHLAADAASRGLVFKALAHGGDLAAAVSGADAVVNCGLDPVFFTEPYDEAHDYDLWVARACAAAGAGFVMCSTRRVYPASVRLCAREDDPATGDDTFYGRNKSISEQMVRRVHPQCLILRLSNIFGFEYMPARGRHSFFGRMMSGLRQEGRIRFAMAAHTRRDFLPVEICARAILTATQAGAMGTFNLGAGFSIECGKLAQGLIEGYGNGELIVENPVVTDEFHLATDKWRERFGTTSSAELLYERSVELGKELRLA